jgi:hypothetical protein
MKKLMKNLKLLAHISITILVLTASGLQAQEIIPLRVNVKLVAQAQGLDHEQVGSSQVFRSSISKLRITTRDVMKLVETACGTTFPGGRLVIDGSGGDFLVLDGAGAVVTNLTTSGFFGNFFDNEGGFLRKGTVNEGTGGRNTTDVFLNTLTFNDEGNTNSLTFSGIEQETISIKAGNGKITDSFKLTGSGSGQLMTPPAGAPFGSVPFFLVTGTISGKGKGVVDLGDPE